MRPLIEYLGVIKDAIVDAADWKYVGKVCLIIIPTVIWTVYWFLLELLYKASNWINEKGGNALDEFMNND